MGVGADDLAQGQLQGGEQVEVVGGLQVVDELHQGFGVGAAAEGDAFLLEPLLDDGVVLDDAVVHQGKVARGRQGAGGRWPCEGSPWVAQRVWAMPVCPARSCPAAARSSSLTLPVALYTFSCPCGVTRATPALSYPLYSSLFNPFTKMGYASLFTYVSYYSTHDMLLYLWVICFVVHSFGHPFELGLGHPSELGLGYPSEWGLGYPSEFPAWVVGHEPCQRRGG